MSRGFLVLRSTGQSHGLERSLASTRPPPAWQVILGLSRYGGLRTPSETLSLRWEDIDWEMNRMSIPEPKVEHHEG
ncbi:MAG: integrase, partial [Pirellulaceae bacterium]